MNTVAREQITLTLATLDSQSREIEIDDRTFQSRTWFEVDLQHLSLAIGVDRHIDHLALGRTLRDVVNLIARNALDRATLHHNRTGLTVAIQDVVDRALVVALEDTYIIYILIEECLILHLCHFVATIFGHHEYLVQIRAVAHKLIFAHRRSDTEETFGAIDIELSICYNHLRSLNRVELAQLATAVATLAILLLNAVVVGYGILGQMFQIVLNLANILLDTANQLVGLG